ncbi:MAG: hypothetical protein KUG67_03650, partial [Proteobacteria bacterium]|nr:hypothetical protein [Pseudomonadota bacterium]
GEESRQWMLDHWAPEKMAGVFLQHYNDVLKEPRKPFPHRFSLDTPASTYRNIELYNNIWQARQQYWPREIPNGIIRYKTSIGNMARKLGLLNVK